jgi:uncharacterized membrane protein YsdA (DUF1294 family)/cold shock CspA family protein
MRSQKAPRYQGRITSWKDEQGFGFITPHGGGPAVFVHISAFRSQGVRPASNDIVTYHLGANEKGPRAEQVALVRARAPQKPSADAKQGSLIAAAGFLGFVALSILTGKLPSAFFGLYLGASAVAFLVYAADKAAARKNARRIKESTLHLLGLAGGWPGALAAQQLLRHKSKKESFRKTFRATVLVNCGVLVCCLTPSAARVLREIFGAP